METLENMSVPCPHDICDGSGFVEQGIYDDSEMSKCLCLVEKERDELEMLANS